MNERVPTDRRTIDRVAFAIGLIALSLVAVVVGALYAAYGNGRSGLTFDSKSHNAERTRRNAMSIALASREYREEFGVWPERLTDLTPDYMETVPGPFHGTGEWLFRRGFIAFHADHSYPICTLNFEDLSFGCDE